MNVELYMPLVKIQNKKFVEAFKKGLAKHGDLLIHHDAREKDSAPIEDVRITHGMLDTKQCNDGIHRFVFDKGYDRQKIPNSKINLYWSVKYMPDWPETRLLCNAPHDRLFTMPTAIHPFRTFKEGEAIFFAPSSQNYAKYYGLGDSRKYAETIIRAIGKKTTRDIWYRPKQTTLSAKPIKNSFFHTRRGIGGMIDAIARAHVIITDGSGIAAHSIMYGTPAITLVGGIAYSVTEHTLDNLEAPFWPTDRQRKNWVADIGYSQYKKAEIESGLAWEVMKQKLQ